MTNLVEVLTQPQRALPVVRVAAHMAWVDRRLVADEVSAARSVATVLGVEAAGAGLLAGGPSPTVSLESAALEAQAGELVYATALWVALADGVLDPIEKEALHALARCLRLEPERRENIESLVWPWAGNAGDWERRYAGVLTQLVAAEGGSGARSELASRPERRAAETSSRRPARSSGRKR